MVKSIGLVGPRQVEGDTREFETDGGEGTTFCITPTETTLALQIVEYNAEGKVVRKSAVWRITTTAIEISMVPYHEGRWGLKGTGGVVWDIKRAGDDGIQFAIHDPLKGEFPSNVPQFTQIASGGKSKHILAAIKVLIELLPDATQSSMITPYIILERIYEAIALEKDFITVS